MRLGCRQSDWWLLFLLEEGAHSIKSRPKRYLKKRGLIKKTEGGLWVLSSLGEAQANKILRKQKEELNR